jgi:hypothetical protein
MELFHDAQGKVQLRVNLSAVPEFITAAIEAGVATIQID